LIVNRLRLFRTGSFSSNAVIMILPLLMLLALVPGRELPDGETALVRQMLDRGWHAVAEQHCRRGIEEAGSADARAEWELLLADCHEQHLWLLESAERNELLRLATSRLTESVQDHNLQPELDLLLRVRQIELIASVGRIETLLRAPVPVSFPGPQGSFIRGMEPAGEPATSPLLTQGLDHSAALLKQLESQRELDRQIAREARERLQLAAATLRFGQSVRMAADAAVMLRTEAIALAETLARSTSNPERKWSARRLRAELELLNGDQEAFALQLTALRSLPATPAQVFEVDAVAWRGLLQDGRPSEVLAGASAPAEPIPERQVGVASQALLAIRLQALLQVHELIWLTGDEADTRAERHRSAVEFQAARQQAMTITRGVWQERCRLIAARFDRVVEVGPDAASRLEAIVALEQSGELEEARRQLRSLIALSGTAAPRIRAGLLLQTGELDLRVSDWVAAESSFRQSQELFAAASLPHRAAAADLLRVFAIGQLWKHHEATAAGDASRTGEVRYRTALDEHLQRFTEESTAITAHEWRARLRRTADPLSAAEELLLAVSLTRRPDAVDPESTMSRKSADLVLEAGVTLLDARELIEPASETKEWQIRWVDACRQCESRAAESLLASESSESRSAAGQHIPVRVLSHVLQVISAGSEPDDWKMRGMDTAADRSALSAIPDDASETVQRRAARERLLIVCHELELVAAVRQLASPSTWSESQASLQEQDFDSRLNSARRLMRWLPTTREAAMHPGDPQLAAVVLSLVKLNDGEAVPAVPLLIRRAAVIQQAARVADRQESFDLALEQLAELSLDDQQLECVAALAALPHGGPSGSVADTMSAQTLAVRQRFWERVRERSKSGSDSWLEASLQLAMLSQMNRRPEEALRIVRVVDVLHPEWGNAERRRRAAELRRQLESAP
jgi:hypothetical protein